MPRGRLKTPKGLPSRKNPCENCPLDDGRVKVPPFMPEEKFPVLCTVGLGPSSNEERTLIPMCGEGGGFLREEMNRVGLRAGNIDEPKDGSINVGFANLTRCRPDYDNFDSKEWKKAATHCQHYLNTDLAGNYPLVLLGTEALKKLLRDNKAILSRLRGLWHLSPTGREVFPTWHPVGVLREMHEKGESKSRKLRQFRQDWKRIANRIFGRDKPPDVNLTIFTNPGEAASFLDALSKRREPWAFDIEAYDGGEFPGRKAVGTNPFHPDFMVRGLAIALSPNDGVWIELAPWQDRKKDAAKLLGPAFASSALKIAFHGNYDEAGLVYSRWTPRVVNRRADGMLALVAANSGGVTGFTLERAVVEILGEPQYWLVDKNQMRDLPIERVAEGCVRDACSTFKLTKIVHDRLMQGKYITPADEVEWEEIDSVDEGDDW